jgi:hypothetical protein
MVNESISSLHLNALAVELTKNTKLLGLKENNMQSVQLVGLKNPLQVLRFVLAAKKKKA